MRMPRLQELYSIDHRTPTGLHIVFKYLFAIDALHSGNYHPLQHPVKALPSEFAFRKTPLVLIWQRNDVFEREWIAEILGPYIDEHVSDGQHKIVLDDCIVADSYLHAGPSEYFERFRGRKAWLLHLSDETYEGGYRHYANFKGVLRNYWSSVFDVPGILQFPLGYAEGLPQDFRNQESANRRYLWNFAGAAGKGSRPDMLRALLPIGPSFTLITDGQAPVKSLGRKEYFRVLVDSVFTPCPMGNVNLDTFRIYEALECGSIPILEKRLTLDYFTKLFKSHPLPAFQSWGSAAAFVAQISADPERLRQLQSVCSSWWNDYKEKLRNETGAFLDATSGSHAAPHVKWQNALPGWQAAELLRHHSMAAATRRITRQIERITKGQKLRVTEGR